MAMKQTVSQMTALGFAACLAASPAAGEEKAGDGFSLMEQGAKLLMEGIMQEMEPAIEDLRRFGEEVEPGLRRFIAEMGPALGELMQKIDDFTVYEPPELLPNGDIIIRRKPPLDPETGKPVKPDTSDAPGPGGEIDL